MSRVSELSKSHIVELIEQYYFPFNERGISKILAEDHEGLLLHYFTETAEDLADLFLKIEPDALEGWFNHYFNKTNLHYIFKSNRGYHIIVMPEYDLKELC